MLEQVRFAVAWLNAIDPVLPRALLVVAVLLTVYLFRKFFPRTWEFFARAVPVAVVDPAPVLLLLSKAWQALPGTLIGAAMMAVGSGGDVKAALKGALGGAVAALAHEVLKAVPWIPYQGAVGKMRPPTLPVLVLFVPAVFVSVQPWLATGCLGKVEWPKLATCAAPLEQPLLVAVAEVLAGTGDVESELAGIAKTHAAEAVLCAVQQLVADLGAAPVTARASRQVVRGRAFLAEVRAQ